MAILQMNNGYCREIFEIDFDGQPIYKDKARSINVRIMNHLQTVAGVVPFTVAVRVDKSIANNIDNIETVAVAWLAESLPARMEKLHYWNFFENTWLDCSTECKVTDVKKGYAIEREITLAKPLEELAEAALVHLQAVKNQFDPAKTKLHDWAFNNTPYGFKQTLSEARQELNKIRKIVSSSTDLGGTNAIHVNTALKDYEDLARRTVESNVNYQRSLRSLRRFTYSLSFPKNWGSRPVL